MAGDGLRSPVNSLASARLLQSNNSADLVFVNGKFLDGRGVVGSAIAIRNGRIVSVGQSAVSAAGAQRIDLGGRAAIPGLFDAHVHYARAAVNPGHEARRIERAFSIAELQEAIARRAQSVPAGEFITCIGGWNHTQFTETADDIQVNVLIPQTHTQSLLEDCRNQRQALWVDAGCKSSRSAKVCT